MNKAEDFGLKSKKQDIYLKLKPWLFTHEYVYLAGIRNMQYTRGPRLRYLQCLIIFTGLYNARPMQLFIMCLSVTCT